MYLGETMPDVPHSTSKSWSDFSAGSESENESEAQSRAQSRSSVPMLIPVMGKELAHVQFRSLEEQLFRAMAVLHDQEQRHFVAKMVGSKTPISVVTPVIRPVSGSEARRQRFLEACYAKLPFALRSVDAQKLLDDRKATLTQMLLKESADEIKSTKRRIR